MAENTYPYSHSINEHFVRPIPFKAHRITGFTPEILERYYEDEYGGSVRSLNGIEAKIADARKAGTPKSELLSLAARQAELVDLIVFQELFLAGLAEDVAEDGGEDPEDGDLKQALIEGFGSVSNWKAEIAMMAASHSEAPEWVVLAWCERFGRLQNVASHGGRLVLCGSVPILALDLRPHIYAPVFGEDQLSYVDTYLQNIHWGRVAQGLASTLRPSSRDENQSEGVAQISVAELRDLMENEKDAPLVLDIRHGDDRERYPSRIADTDWRNSFKVAEWVDEIPRDRPVIVYCMYGFWVSQKVAGELRAEGIDAYSLEGGVTAWRAMGLPSSDYEI